jgi:hypothetical protein
MAVFSFKKLDTSKSPTVQPTVDTKSLEISRNWLCFFAEELTEETPQSESHYYESVESVDSVLCHKSPLVRSKATKRKAKNLFLPTGREVLH